MLRVRQAVFVVSTLLLSWLLFQAVHEMGHMLAAWVTGGRVTQVVLHPVAISRTDVNPNPHPLIVAWSGPVLGALVPVAVLSLLTVMRLPAGFIRFFTGFCLIANGAYIAFGSFQRIGDCGEMLRYGSPIWLLWLFGVATIVAGLWRALGEYFGLRNARDVGLQETIVVTVGVIVVAAMEMAFSRL
jgi:hypothetical protein